MKLGFTLKGTQKSSAMAVQILHSNATAIYVLERVLGSSLANGNLIRGLIA